MTSLLNPNDIEIKNKLINNINNCIENLQIEGLINNYINNHFKLNIEKDKLLEYIILLIQKKVLDRIIYDYNQVDLLNIESINTFNSYILSITNIKYENNKPLLNLINIIYNKWRSQDIDFIYYHIYNLKKSNDKCLNLINVSIDELDNNYNHMISINNSIKELRETNKTHMNLIKELRETNENHMNLIKELREITNYLIILMLIILFKIIIIYYYNDINIK
jgi:hypothetical protein